jgi:hypothetical protein
MRESTLAVVNVNDLSNPRNTGGWARYGTEKVQTDREKD